MHVTILYADTHHSNLCNRYTAIHVPINKQTHLYTHTDRGTCAYDTCARHTIPMFGDHNIGQADTFHLHNGKNTKAKPHPARFYSA